MSNSNPSSEAPPFFTVVVPTFNRRQMCERAIRSVLAQSDGDWELVVADDGSSDGTDDMVRGIGDPRVRYARQENSGAAAARNLGIARAAGRYTCFLDSDDEYLPDHLATLRSAIASAPPGPAMYFTLAYTQRGATRSDRGNPVSTAQTPVLLGDNPETPCVCIASEVLKSCPFDTQFKKHEDAELWGRIAHRATVRKIERRTVVVHVHDGPRMTSGSAAHFREMKRTYEHIEATRGQRSYIPPAALRRKWREIYLGMLETHTDVGLRRFLDIASAALAKAGPGVLINRRFARAALEGIRGRAS